MRAAVVAVMLALAAGPAAAQARHGFWIDAGVGFGRLRLTDTSGVVGRANGTTVTVAFGGSTEKHVLLGFEGQVWSGSSRGPHQRITSIIVMTQWYPLSRLGLFLRGGTGIVNGRVARADTSATLATVRGTGVSFSIGIGYDLVLGRHLALTAQSATHIDALGDLALPGATFDDTIAYVSRLSLAVTVR